jgi:hypothetical protein
MRFRLRTLLIVLALAPPMLAGVWWLLTAMTSPSGDGSEMPLFVAGVLLVVFAIAAER